jgi:hypothetical protein
MPEGEPLPDRMRLLSERAGGDGKGTESATLLRRDGSHGTEHDDGQGFRTEAAWKHADRPRLRLLRLS